LRIRESALYNKCMATFFNTLGLTFIPLFIVLDAFGNLPIVVALTHGMTRREKYRVVNTSILTATLVGLAFLFFGQLILKALGISVGSFTIAGGIILLVLSIKYMITGHMVEAVAEDMVAVVPIGTPLLTGPATITTLLFLATQFSLYTVLLAFVLNLILAWLIFIVGDRIMHFLGQGGIKALSKVFSLLLGAIAVDLIIRGLTLMKIIVIPSS
jgi:multiple antibiotic resistance protein